MGKNRFAAHAMPWVAALAALAMLAAPASAEQKKKSGSTITSNRMEAAAENTVFVGKVDFKQGDMRIQADRMVSRAAGETSAGEEQVSAVGHVVITRELAAGARIVLTGDRASYRSSDGWGELTGSPKARRIDAAHPEDEAVLLADAMEFFEDGERLHAKGNVRMARPGEALTSEQAWYYRATDEMLAAGKAHVVRKTDSGTVTCDSETARFYFKTGMAKFLGGARIVMDMGG